MDYSMSAAQKAQPDVAPIGAAHSYRIRRPGARPLAFAGSELAMAMSFTPEIPYWYEINIYRTNDRRFVLAVRQFFQSESEDDRTNAWVYDTLPEVFDALEAYDAARDVHVEALDLDGMSAVELTVHALDLKARMEAARAHFGGLVGELLSELEDSTGGKG